MNITEFLNYPENAGLTSFFEFFPNDIDLSVISVNSEKYVIRQDEIASRIYILLEGSVRAYISQDGRPNHTFMDFHAPEMFGEQEVFADMNEFGANIKTKTPCKFLIISKEDYTRWMLSDSKTLFKRTKSIIKVLLLQNIEEIHSLYMNGTDRMKKYIADYYARENKNGTVVVKETRSIISEKIGFSIRTVNRAIEEMKNEGLVELIKGKIVLSEENYEKLKAGLESK